jgi:hypothetical protein
VEQAAELAGVGLEAKLEGKLAHLVGLQAGQRVDFLADDFPRGPGGDFLDVHAAFGAGNDDRAAGLAVHEDGEVVFLEDFHRLGDHHAAHQAAGRTGLVGHQGLAEHFGGERAHFLR